MNDPYRRDIQRGSTPSPQTTPPSPKVKGSIRYGPTGTVYDRDTRTFIETDSGINPIEAGMNTAGGDERRGGGTKKHKMVITNTPPHTSAPQASSHPPSRTTASLAYEEAIDAPSEVSGTSKSIDSALISMDLAALDDHHPSLDQQDFTNVVETNKRRIRVPKVKAPSKHRRKKIRLTALGYCVVIFFFLAIAFGLAYVFLPVGTATSPVALLVDGDGGYDNNSGGDMRPPASDAFSFPVGESLEDAVIQSEVEESCHVDKTFMESSQSQQMKCLKACQAAECCFKKNENGVPPVLYGPHCAPKSSVRCESYEWCEILVGITTFGMFSPTTTPLDDISPSAANAKGSPIIQKPSLLAEVTIQEVEVSYISDDPSAASEIVADFINNACDEEKRDLSRLEYYTACAKACSVANCCWDPLDEAEDCSSEPFCDPYAECIILLDYRDVVATFEPQPDEEGYDLVDDEDLLTGQVELLCNNLDESEVECLNICRPSECCFNGDIPCSPALVGCNPYANCEVLLDNTDFATLQTNN